jgi:hypothetical protein
MMQLSDRKPHLLNWSSPGPNLRTTETSYSNSWEDRGSPVSASLAFVVSFSGNGNYILLRLLSVSWTLL